ncbi:MAG: alpha/beta hydrolase [Myxococcaceae bacterium]|nr:alpha/beta hydrolase [Myxococcaceae bacterium]
MKLNAFVVGQGTRGTVLLHGFLGSGRNLRTLATRWAERDPSRIFLLPDLAGHGASPNVDDTTDLRSMGRDVIETARAAGFEGPLDLVGHSLGGRVALAAALAAPEEVAQVVLLDIGPGPIDGDTSESGRVLDVLIQAPALAAERRTLRQFLMDHGLSGALADWLMMNVEPKDGGYGWRFDRAALRTLHARVNREDLWPALRSRPSTLSVSVIRGGRSPYVSHAEAKRMEQAGWRVFTLPEAGHYVHVDALEALLDRLAAI